MFHKVWIGRPAICLLTVMILAAGWMVPALDTGQPQSDAPNAGNCVVYNYDRNDTELTPTLYMWNVSGPALYRVYSSQWTDAGLLGQARSQTQGACCIIPLDAAALRTGSGSVYVSRQADGEAESERVQVSCPAAATPRVRFDVHQAANSAQGGGMDLRGTAVLYAGTFTGGSAAGHGGGIYVASTGELTLSGTVKIVGNTSDDCFLAAGRRVTLSGPLSETSTIGIAMERPGQVTVGAKEDTMDRFFPNAPGTFLVRTEAGELALRAYSIVTQPTGSNPTVVVGHPEGVTYQWYTATSAAITDPLDLRCDDSGRWTPDADGACCTLTLDALQILRVLPDAPLPEGTALMLSGSAMTQSEDGTYQLTSSESGVYTLHCDAPAALRLELYTVTDPAEGEITDTLTAAHGAYVCRVTWPDGQALQSQLVVLPENAQPEPSEPVSVRPAAVPFTDLEPGAWYYPSVVRAYQHGWMVGVDTTHFSPNMPVSRGMLVAILWRLSNRPSAADDMPFVDVSEDSYYYEALCWATEQGIAFGMDAVHFCPEAYATREQAAAFFHRCALVSNAELLNGKRSSQWAESDVEWAVGTGLLVGDPDGWIDPAGLLTRAQTAVILTRFAAMH